MRYIQRLFSGYATNPTKSTEEVVYPYGMKDIILPIVPQQSSSYNEEFYMANCFNIIYRPLGQATWVYPEGEGYIEWNPDSFECSIKAYESLEKAENEEDGEDLTWAGIISDTTVYTRDTDFYLMPASQYTPHELRLQILNGTEILGTIPGAIFISPNLYSRKKFIRIKGLPFYLSTSDIGALLTQIDTTYDTLKQLKNNTVEVINRAKSVALDRLNDAIPSYNIKLYPIDESGQQELTDAAASVFNQFIETNKIEPINRDDDSLTYEYVDEADPHLTKVCTIYDLIEKKAIVEGNCNIESFDNTGNTPIRTWKELYGYLDYFNNIKIVKNTATNKEIAVISVSSSIGWYLEMTYNVRGVDTTLL